MKQQIKRIEFGEMGAISAIEFYEGGDVQETMRMAISLAWPYISSAELAKRIQQAFDKVANHDTP